MCKCREIFVDCSETYFLYFYNLLMSVVLTPLHCSREWGNLSAEDATCCRCHRKDRFQNWWPWLTLISPAWEEMMRESYRWSRSDAGADYLISLSNWPESCSFSSAQLRYLNLISVYKSIWGFVFILVCWECWGKRESIIHNSLNLTDDRNKRTEKIAQRVLFCAFHVNIKRNPSMLKRVVEK